MPARLPLITPVFSRCLALSSIESVIAYRVRVPSEREGRRLAMSSQ
jgi:hypothetical protein